MNEWEYAYTALVILGAGIIRGYSGFGFAMITAIFLTFIFPPSQVTPVILCLEVAASSWLCSKVWKEIDWKGLGTIGLGALITLPLGSLALVAVPVRYMRIFISMMVISLCGGLLWKKKSFGLTGRFATTLVGMVSGFLSGVSAMGGPPIILFYFSSDRSVSVGRASMIAFFLFIDSFALVSSWFYGLLNTQTLVLSGSLLLPLTLGIWTGNFLFNRFANEQTFKKQVICLLMVISCVSLIKFAIIN